MKRFIARLACLAFICFSLGLNLAYAEELNFFTLEYEDTQGQKQSLAQYKGQPVVVNFWATWCPPCVKEMPDLQSLSEQHTQVQFVGLAIDTQRNVKKFLEKILVSYDLYVPGHAGVNDMRALGNHKAGLPFTLIIGADGDIQHRLLGQIDKQQVASILQKFQN